MKSGSKMSGDEVLAEVEWLLGGGIHPEHIAKQVDRSVAAITRIARRHGHAEIARRFGAVEKAQLARAAA